MTAAQLKASILQLAIQGKLVPQDADDEPAEVLLERIRGGQPAALTQRTQRAQRDAKTVGADVLGRPQSSESGKSEKEEREANTKNSLRSSANFAFSASAPAGKNPVNPVKKYPPVTDDEKPFDIPANWTWCRLGEIVELLSGRDLEPQEYNDVGKGMIYVTGPSCLSAVGVLEKRWTESPCVIAHKGDVLLVCKGAGYGNSVVCDKDAVHIARQIMALQENSNLSMLYVRLYLEASVPALKSFGQGVIPGIDRKSVLSMVFPLPPLAEQKRIVAKIEELMPLVERYAAAKAASDELEANLPDAFRKSVLQQAVEGKLVPQDPNDEPAEALLARIECLRQLPQRTQRAQRGAKSSHSLRSSANFAFSASAPAGKNPVNPVNPVKKYPPVTDDEKPFDLPANWTWCRLGEIAEIIRGNGIKRDETTSSGVHCVRYGELYTEYKNRIKIKQIKSYTSAATAEKAKRVECGDLLVSLTGENKEEIGMTVAYLGHDDVVAGGDLAIVRQREVDPVFLSYFMSSPTAILQKANASNGDIIVHLSAKSLAEIVVPLPPIAEQKRIVAEVERLLALGEKLRQD